MKPVCHISLNTDDIEILIDDNHSTVIELNDEFTLVMRYPTVKDTLSVMVTMGKEESVYFWIKNCIDKVIVGEEIYN